MTTQRLRLDLCDGWDVVLDPSRARIRARLRTARPHWLECQVSGVHARRASDGGLTLTADRLRVSVDGGAITDSSSVVDAVDDLLATLQRFMRGDRDVDAVALPIRSLSGRRRRRACG